MHTDPYHQSHRGEFTWNWEAAAFTFSFTSRFLFLSGWVCVRDQGNELLCNKDTEAVPQISHAMPFEKVKTRGDT